ncbi:hypothetical protein Tco_1434373 [Tanacetum coccineum]
MSNITNIKSVLTQKGLDTFCRKFHIPESVHPQLPSRNQTMHERPVGKIGVYTRFFEYANFRLPLFTFLVDVLKYFRINLSQLSVIAAAKVSHFEILCRVYSIELTVLLFCCFYVNSKNKGWMSFSKRSDNSSVCYTKPLDSLKHWNDHFFRVDAFACLVSFPWHTDKNVSRDPLPKSTEFNVDDYVVLVAHPAPFWKFPEPFLCLVGMSRYYTLDEDTYPRFLHDDGEGGCLSLYIVHLVVFNLIFDYLFVYAEVDLFAFIHVVDPTKVKIVERECDEGERKVLDSTIGRVVPLLPVAPARAEGDLEASVDRLFDEGGNTNQGDSDASGGRNDVIEPVTDVEDIAAENVTAQRPKRQRKKRPAVTVGVATGGKSPSIIKELLASSILNAEAGVTAVATLPFITSSISAIPEREGGYPTDSVTEPNLRTIGPTERFVISLDSSHHSSTNALGAEVDSIIRYVVLPPMMTEAVVTSHATSAPSIPVPETETKNTSLVHPSIFPNSGFAETVRPDVTCPFYSAEQDLSMGSRELNTETLHQVFIPQWNVLNDSLLDDSDVSREFIDHLAPPALRRLESECKKQADLLKARDGEIENLKAQLLLKEAEATKVVRLRIQKNVALEKEKDALDGKVAEFQSSIVDKERMYPET